MRKPVQLRYWKADIHQFAFWFATAFIAGATPALVRLIHWVYLLAAYIIAAAIAFAIWVHTRRKRGIGVYINIPAPADAEPSDELLKFVHRIMDKRHRDWFRSGPDRSNCSTADRAGWAIETIRHRLNEAELRDNTEADVYFYIRCHIPAALTLGQQYSKQSAFSVRPRVRSLSTYARTSGQLHEIDLSCISTEPNEGALLNMGARSLSAMGVGNRQSTTNRLSIILHVGNPVQRDDFVERAAQAASGVKSNGYLIDENDRCDYAITVGIDSSELFPRLVEGTAEEYMRQIKSYWEVKTERIYGRSDVPVRLFTNCPAVLAFAVGTFLPSDSVLVPYDRVLASAEEFYTGVSDDELIGIIDGDDVGTRTENSLLRGELEDAIEYSSRVDADLTQLSTELSRLPGLRLLSTGGDSVIFEFPVTSLHAVEKTLERAREELSLSVSCGYGNRCDTAYQALRIAKTSGKNITTGQSIPLGVRV